jgi:hypothetical protein
MKNYNQACGFIRRDKKHTCSDSPIGVTRVGIKE